LSENPTNFKYVANEFVQNTVRVEVCKSKINENPEGQSEIQKS